MTQTTPNSGRRIPDNFLLAAGAAAFQIEGAANEDGRQDSIWDTFCRVPGAVVDAHNGDVACDHYHRYREDIALMKKIGLDSYRFSTSWARVVPDGKTVNQKGIDFYAKLIDELNDNGIMPWLTLYHWDLPQTLQDLGGWQNRDTAYRFQEYAAVMQQNLGDKVNVWTTMNEPWCSAFLGYTSGEHAPGLQDPRAGLVAAHHLMLAHGLATQTLRAADRNLTLGITLNQDRPIPLDPNNPDDVDAARRIDGQFNRLFLDPLFKGSYPADLLEDVAEYNFTEVIQPGDLEIISTKFDVLGVNHYNGRAVSKTPPQNNRTFLPPTDRKLKSPFPAADGVHTHPRDLPVTAQGWEIEPYGLTSILNRIHNEYSAEAGVKLYVTENGAAYNDEVIVDPVSGEKTVADPERTSYLEQHIAATLDAIDQGTPVFGYFYWSIMDNFEWAWGYYKRFGIVYVDFDTQERILKDSAKRYQQIISSRTL